MNISLRPSRAATARRPRRGAVTALVAVVAAVGISACEPVPTVPTPPSASDAIWISQGELAQLPTSGTAWNNVVKEANSNWGSPSLSDNNATHDTSTLAGALVAARTGDSALTAKTRSAIMSVTKVTSYARVLEMSRNITSYVIAADIIGLPQADDAKFKAFISGLRTKPLSGHSGGDDLRSTALRSTNNWGTMARAAMVSIDLYLDDDASLRQVANAHRAFLGENVANSLKYTDTKWHASSSKAGINRRGAVISGRSADGVLPEDQRRTGEPSSSAPAKGSYPWEGLQGALVTGAMLDRAGIVDITAGDHALSRAFQWLYHTNGNAPSGDDTWQPWVLNRLAGTNFAAKAGTSPGKNMGWSDWTHGPRG